MQRLAAACFTAGKTIESYLSTLRFVGNNAFQFDCRHLPRGSVIHKPSPKTTWISKVADLAKELFPRMVQMRRHLHQNPELSDHEFATTQFLSSTLAELSLTCQTTNEKRGLFADLVTGTETQKRLAIRGDIDALPIADAKTVDYKSSCPGIMHACGHDAHATIIFATLQILHHMQQREQLPWPIAVRGIFQPSEERATGARYMIDQGALNNVDSILALHVDPTRKVGSVGMKGGVLTAAADLMTVRFRGKGGHGARPHLTIDPIDACSAWIQDVYRRIARTADAQRTVVFSVGQMHAGNSANVIPDFATLSGTLRSLDQQSRQQALKTLDQTCRAIEIQTGCDISLELDFSAPAVINSPDATELICRSVDEVIGPSARQEIDSPSMGSEDFSYYLEHVPGAMFRLGIAGEETGHAALHTPEFDLDEEALRVGAQVFATCVINHFAPR